MPDCKIIFFFSICIFFTIFYLIWKRFLINNCFVNHKTPSLSTYERRDRLASTHMIEKVGIYPHDWHILQQAVPLKALALV